MKRGIIILIALLTINFVSANLITYEEYPISNLIYITIIALSLIITLFFVLMRKLQQDKKKLIKVISFSVLITIILEILILYITDIYTSLYVPCQNIICPTALQSFFQILPYTAPIILLDVLVIYYFLKFIAKKSN